MLTTHGSKEALDCCSLLAAILCEAIADKGREAVHIKPSGAWASSVQALANRQWVSKLEDEINSDGYVIHTLEAALWAFTKSSTFEESILTAVNLGNDADTVAAVCGQIAGAVWGYSAIPEHWVLKLYQLEKIKNIAT